MRPFYFKSTKTVLKNQRRARLILASMLVLFVLNVGFQTGCSNSLIEAGGELSFAPSTFSMKRLTQRQLVTSIQDLLGIDAWEPLGALPNDGASSADFEFPSLAATNVTTSSLDFDRYRNLAKEASETAFPSMNAIEARLACRPSVPNDPCIKTYFQNQATRAWGRDVKSDDPTLQDILDVVASANAEMGNIPAGIQWGMITLLQSAEFLYFVPEISDAKTLSPFSKARHLALIFNGSVPDQELMNAAKNHELDSLEGLEKQVDRLIAKIYNNASARKGIMSFFEEWLNLDVIALVGKDTETFPDFSESLKVAMQEELRQSIVKVVFDEKKDIREFFHSTGTFVNSELATIYDMEDPRTMDLVWEPFPANSPRSGFFSSAGFLAMKSHPSTTTPTLRGRYIIQRILCQEIPLPPPNFDTTVPDPIGHETKRDKFVRHATDPNCSGCHDLMDPPGFTLEEFDALGYYRKTEEVWYNNERRELPINTTGTLLGNSFSNSKEFAQKITNSSEFGQCIAKQLTENALGRSLSFKELESIKAELSRDSSLKVLEWLKKIVLKPSFWLIK